MGIERAKIRAVIVGNIAILGMSLAGCGEKPEAEMIQVGQGSLCHGN
ncbi:MAG: hypothetical protein K2Y22_07720 [Candidatus Obscuribacterales bacterium]|nr:hypothetical protein [Candidatus Obscuribacterales bacterium]